MPNFDYTFNPAIARYDDHAAARIFQYLCPDPQSERAVARLFAASILAAHETAPSSWEVTLDRHFVRLNVGPVAALSLHEDGLYMYVAKPLHVARGTGLRWWRIPPLAAMKEFAHGDWIVAMNSAASVPSSVIEAHHRYIEAAAARRRISFWPESHSPSAVRHIERLARRRLPRPEYFKGADMRVLPLAEEVVPPRSLYEGATYTVQTNAYERNPEAHRRCIEHYGSACVVCGFSFGNRYMGPEFDGYIHVHHLRPLSKVAKRYKIDPVKDLRPVCANCHAAMHRQDPPFRPEELRRKLRRSARQLR